MCSSLNEFLAAHVYFKELLPIITSTERLRIYKEGKNPFNFNPHLIEYTKTNALRALASLNKKEPLLETYKSMEGAYYKLASRSHLKENMKVLYSVHRKNNYHIGGGLRSKDRSLVASMYQTSDAPITKSPGCVIRYRFNPQLLSRCMTVQQLENIEFGHIQIYDSINDPVLRAHLSHDQILLYEYDIIYESFSTEMIINSKSLFKYGIITKKLRDELLNFKQLYPLDPHNFRIVTNSFYLTRLGGNKIEFDSNDLCNILVPNNANVLHNIPKKL